MTLARVFLFLLLTAAFSYPAISFAQDDDVSASETMDEEEEVLSLDEAGDLIDSLPTAKDAIKGNVPTEANAGKYYDIHGRQLSYRESAKEFRGAIDERRENYVAPQVAALEQYRETLEKVYAAETKAYQDSLAEEEAEREAQEEEQSDDAPIGEETVDVDSEDDEGLTERDITAHGEEGDVKKTVITTDDAPDFDPSNL